MLARSGSRFIYYTVAALALSGVVTTFATRVALSADAAPAAAASMAPQAGQPAPDFKLQDQNGKWVTLGEQKGKWVVLYFYPKDNTPGCTTQACEFRDEIFGFRKANAVVLGVSVDDLESHKKFAAEHGLPFSILADSTKATATRYGVLTKFGTMEVAARETFLIDPQGKIVKHYKVGRDDLDGHSKLVLADIDTFKKSG